MKKIAAAAGLLASLSVQAGWEAKVTADPMTDLPNVMLTNVTADFSGGLFVACNAGQQIVAAIAYDREFAHGDELDYRVDGAPMVTVPALARGQEVVAYRPGADRMIRAMIAGQTLLARAAKGPGGHTSILEFNLSGFAATFEEHCGDHEQYSDIVQDG